jgi:hypothetical protein
MLGCDSSFTLSDQKNVENFGRLSDVEVLADVRSIFKLIKKRIRCDEGQVR